MTLALGIDVGTGGVRAVLLGAQGVVAKAAARMADCGEDPRAPATWGSALARALAALGDLGGVGAVAVDGTSGTLLGLDASDQPVGPALMYNDPVTDPTILAAVAALAPRESAAHGPTSGLAKALALQSRPGVVAVLHQADWIAAQLTGDFTLSDESNALKTGYDPVARHWPDWIAATGLTARLPRVVAVGARMSHTRATHGLPAGVPVIAGCTDGCASFLATGARDPGDAVTALGSTLTLKILTDHPVFAPEYGIYSHRIGERWLPGGASNTGGAVLEGELGAEAIARLTPLLTPDQPTGLDYYPLSRPGERFPTADPALAPRLTPRPTSDITYLQAMLEGIAAIEAEGYARLAALGAGQPRTLRSVGGGAASAPWTAIRARVLGIPMRPVASEDAAAGVARLARDALA